MTSWLAAINQFLNPLWSLFLGLFGGGIIGAGVSWLFARSGSRELRRELATLRSQVALPTRMIELQGLGDKVGLRRDELGNVIGLSIESMVVDQVGSGLVTQDGEPIVVTSAEPMPKL